MSSAPACALGPAGGHLRVRGVRVDVHMCIPVLVDGDTCVRASVCVCVYSCVCLGAYMCVHICAHTCGASAYVSAFFPVDYETGRGIASHSRTVSRPFAVNVVPSYLLLPQPEPLTRTGNS